MPIIPRLGSFHLLKSYLVHFKVIFAERGILDIIKHIYEGELATNSILNENIYVMARMLFD